ncbi:MAG TPA: hypothetical protein VHZ78_00565 [Rhizomicrobium sp.]|jgi:hypothetical protein|nr:hypothetical protein [Rhizomicrobium sp.]
MNPEFERNLWLELTPRRVALMVGVLALIFFAAALVGNEWTPSGAASALYYLIVVVWGSRSAALSVVGEIRDRTWDGQRLSSLSAGTMMWGKLFGATIYNWLGGAICLTLILVDVAVHQGALAAVIEGLFHVGIGIIAQSAALLASLMAIGRRQSHSRFEIFIYQMIGLVAALLVYYAWSAADPASSLILHAPPTDFVTWWGITIDARLFFLNSIEIFAGWTLLGCYREMRLELKMHNGPLVWLAFLAFMGIYVAGFDAWLSSDLKTWDPVALRLLLAGITFAALTYVMVLLEPKDRVFYRWMLGQIRHGHIARALSGMQAWMMSYWAAFAVAGALFLWLLLHDMQAAVVGQPLVLATMGFITRDVSIFVLMQTLPGKRRGDFAALAILFALYVLFPSILAGLQAFAGLILLYPQLPAPSWTGVIVAWIEGASIAALALGRLALTDEKGKTVPI